MAGNWQDNQTWRSGLLSEFPVSRLQGISGTEITEILVLKKQSTKLSPHPNNLIHDTTLRAGSSVKRIWLSNPEQFMYIAVDLRRRSIEVECKLTKLDMSITVHIDYKVVDARKVVMDNEDALARLSLECQDSVNKFTEKYDHTGIFSDALAQEIRIMDVGYLGVAIEKVMVPHSMSWPSISIKSLEVDCNFTARNYISGSIKVVIDYRFVTPQIANSENKGLTNRLSLECQSVIVELTKNLDYDQITPQLIADRIRNIDVNYLGIALEKVFTPTPIVWPRKVGGQRRTIEVDCAFTTRDFIQGTLKVYLRYRITDAQKVMMEDEDVPNSLSVECRRIITNFATDREHTQISTTQIERELGQIDTSYMGVVIEKASIPDAIVWPSNVIEPVSRLVIQKRDSKLLEEKLRDMGVSHPAAILRVKAQYDKDLKVIFDAIQHHENLEREQKDRALSLLLEMESRDRVTRDQLEDLIDSLAEIVKKDVTKSPDAVASFFIAPSDAPQLADGELKPALTVQLSSEDDAKVIETEYTQTDDMENSTQSHSIQRRKPGDIASRKRGDEHSVKRRPAKPQ